MLENFLEFETIISRTLANKSFIRSEMCWGARKCVLQMKRWNSAGNGGKFNMEIAGCFLFISFRSDIIGLMKMVYIVGVFH